jgi:L-alanine-DL-glutamate epimerase-like enolase superfamily enzyme
VDFVANLRAQCVKLLAMRITRVTALNLAHQVVLVRVHTDAGIEGIGEASPMYPRVICAVINDVLAPLLEGEDPFEIERLHDRMLYSRPGRFCNYKLGPQGALTSAISGIEIALWDVVGKALGQPVYALLGGRYRERVQVFASMALVHERTPDAWAARARHFVEQGFGGVKVAVGQEWGFDGDEDDPVATVGAVREAVGDGVDILVDAHNAYYPHTAATIARELEPYQVSHFEEPVAAYDWEGIAWVRDHTTTPIAAGEQIYTLPEFRRFLAAGAVDILQFDVTKAGGLWAGKKIAALAEAWDVPLTLHNYHSPVATAAMLHLAATTPACRYRQEVRADPHPLADIVHNPPQLEAGTLAPPAAPGLGLELNDERISHYTLGDRNGS